MTKAAGFTLIELVLFIMVTSIMASTVLLTLRTTMKATPAQHNNYLALQAARGCLDSMLAAKALFGWAYYTCPSSAVPSTCAAPTGYNLAVNVACLTLNTDSAYKSITVSVGGLGSAALTTLIANY